MLSKTVAAAFVASAALASATDLPQCWSDCFKAYQASEQCLCSVGLGNVVSHCISHGCDSHDNEAYTAWLSSYCTASVPSTASNTWVPQAATTPSAYTSEATTPSAYTSEATTPPSYTTETPPPSYPSGTAPPAPASYPPASAPSGAAPPYPYGSVSGSVCVRTSTLIWRSSTSVITYEVTATSGWAYPTGTGAAGAAAPTGSAYATPEPPVPYTGSASSFRAAGIAGLAIFLGAAAVLL